MEQPPASQPLGELYAALHDLLDRYGDKIPPDVCDAFYDFLMVVAVRLGRDKSQA